MSTAVMWSKSKPDVEFQYGVHLDDFNGMSSQCHTAGCCHLVNSLSRLQSHMPHCNLQGAVTWRNQCHDRATLQGVRIASAILKIVFRHFLFCFVFNNERRLSYRLWYTCIYECFGIDTVNQFIRKRQYNFINKFCASDKKIIYVVSLVQWRSHGGHGGGHVPPNPNPARPWDSPRSEEKIFRGGGGAARLSCHSSHTV